MQCLLLTFLQHPPWRQHRCNSQPSSICKTLGHLEKQPLCIQTGKKKSRVGMLNMSVSLCLWFMYSEVKSHKWNAFVWWRQWWDCNFVTHDYKEDWYICPNTCLDLFKHCELGVIFLYPHEAWYLDLEWCLRNACGIECMTQTRLEKIVMMQEMLFPYFSLSLLLEITNRFSIPDGVHVKAEVTRGTKMIRDWKWGPGIS